jgi:hypothetical protein
MVLLRDVHERIRGLPILIPPAVSFGKRMLNSGDSVDQAAPIIVLKNTFAFIW